jgi:hypothetical protein
MSNRLKEAEIFASSAPGYWQVFQTPDARRILPSSLIKKPAILGIACGLLGIGIATLLTLLFTHRSSRRSVLECCTATQAPLVACIPTTSEADTRAAIEHFWITQMAPRLKTPRSILWWTPALEPADERRFWSMLASAAWNDTGKPLHIHDLTPDALWSEDTGPDSLKWLAAPPLKTDASAANTATLLRAAALPHSETREQLMQIDYWMAVVAGNKDSLRRASHWRLLGAAYLPPCNGTIAWTQPPAGRVRAIADVISLILARRFS